MDKNELKLEDNFLLRAMEGGVQLRLSLANRERVSGVISNVSRHDINLNTDRGVVTLPKKEISYISDQTAPVEGAVSADRPEPAQPASRSRVQDEFLARFIKEKTLSLMLMVNGDELRGVLEGYDGFTITLRTSRGQVLLYKHGLCSIGPGYRRRQDR